MGTQNQNYLVEFSLISHPLCHTRADSTGQFH